MLPIAAGDQQRGRQYCSLWCLLADVLNRFSKYEVGEAVALEAATHINSQGQANGRPALLEDQVQVQQCATAPVRLTTLHFSG